MHIHVYTNMCMHMAVAYRRARKRHPDWGDWGSSRAFVKVWKLHRGRKRRGVPFDRFGPYRALLIAERSLRERLRPVLSESETKEARR